MRTWERVSYVERCGGCNAVLTENMLMQRIQFVGQKRRLVRCEHCAEGTPPLDLPALPEKYQRGDSTKRMPAIATIAKSVTREYLPYKDP